MTRQLIVGVAALIFTSPQAPPSAGPSIVVAFRATAADGKPVVDLARDDVVLQVGGRPRAIETLQVIHAGTESLLPPPYASNTGLDRGRQVVFVLDEESFAPASAYLLREVVTAAMATLSPRDRVGLVSIHPSGVVLNATRDRAAATAAIPNIQGRAIGRETAIDLSCRTRRVLQNLRGVFDASSDGAAQSVFLLSGLLGVPPVARIPQIGTDGGCPLQPRDFDDLLESFARSGTNFAVLQLVDSGVPAESPERLAGLEKLGGAHGASFHRIVTDRGEAIGRIVDATSAHYLATFRPDPSERTAATYPVEVQVRRNGVSTRTRSTLALARPADTGDASPRAMMRTATAFRDLPLRAAAFPARNMGDNKIKVVVMFEPDGGDTALASAMAGLFDAKGRLIAEWTSQTADLANRPAIAALIVPPGRYRLRVAAVDRAGRLGAVDHDVDAGISTAGPAKLSALVLGVPTSNSIAPRLQFGAEDKAAVAYLEVYGVRKGATITGTLELAAADRNVPLLTAPASPTAVENSDASILFGGFEIAALAPRDYLVTAVLSVDGKVVGRASATLRKR
jgi:hypothetical protein